MSLIHCPLKTRIRTREEIQVDGHFTLRNENNTGLLWENSAVLTMGEVQTMVDEVVDYDALPRGTTCPLSSGKKIFKEVTNTKSSFDYRVSEISYSGQDPDGVAGNTWDIMSSSTYFYSIYGRPIDILDAHTVTDQGLVDISQRMLYDSIQRIKPTFENYVEGVNLYNIILELNDLKKLLGTFVLSAKALTTVASEKHLTYNFGIVPLSGDIKALYDIFTKLDGAIDKWNDFARKGKIMDFHDTIALDWVPLEVTFEGGALVTDRITTTHTMLGLVDRDAKLHIYVRPKIIPENKKFSVYLRALGLDKPITGVWDSVPFSWAIDYFVNVGDLIESWETGIDSMFQYELVEVGYSVKREFDLVHTATMAFNEKSNIDGVKLNCNLWSTEHGGRFLRRRLPASSLFDFAVTREEELKVRMKLGWKQATYLAAVAVLKTLK